MNNALEKTSSRELDRNETGREAPIFQPRVDIAESAGELLLHADMPGVDRETLDITIENRILSIRGQMAHGLHPGGARATWSEYGAGHYSRAFEVGEQIDTGRISAGYTDGVLTVRLPKVKAAQPKKINVTIQK